LYAAVGDINAALDSIERAVEERDPMLVWLKCMPAEGLADPSSNAGIGRSGANTGTPDAASLLATRRTAGRSTPGTASLRAPVSPSSGDSPRSPG
jgi:hypothetical protein